MTLFSHYKNTSKCTHVMGANALHHGDPLPQMLPREGVLTTYRRTGVFLTANSNAIRSTPVILCDALLLAFIAIMCSMVYDTSSESRGSHAILMIPKRSNQKIERQTPLAPGCVSDTM